MSRKRGKQRKAPVEAVPEDILAEGSGPMGRIEQDAIATVDDVVTTDDIATTEDVVTADDVVATPGSAGARSEPEPEVPQPKRAGRSRKSRRPGRASTPGADDAEGDARRGAGRSDAPADEPEGSEIDATDGDDAGREAGGEARLQEATAGEEADPACVVPGERAAEDVAGGAGPGHAVDAAAGSDAAEATAAGEQVLDGELAEDELRTGATEGSDHVADDEGDDAAGDDAADADADAAGVFPTSAATMDAVQLKHLVEALIFASDRPLTVQRLRQLTRVGDVRRLEQALSEIAEDYRERGLVLQQVSGGYQFRTRTQFSPWVQQLIAGRPVRLSRAQLETLAIIAYRQPITRPEIDDIRGVDSTATLKLLIDRALIRVLGKREEVGRPMLYGTTKEFLDFFSLGDLRELPTLREYSELTAESRKVMSDRLGIAADGSDGPGEGGEDPDGGSGNGHGGNGHGGNGHGGNGHGGHGGDDGGAGGPSGLGGGGGGLADDGTPASAAAGGDDAPAIAAEDDAGAGVLASVGAVTAAEDDVSVGGLAEDAGAVSAAQNAAGASVVEEAGAEHDVGASAVEEAGAEHNVGASAVEEAGAEHDVGASAVGEAGAEHDVGVSPADPGAVSAAGEAGAEHDVGVSAVGEAGAEHDVGVSPADPGAVSAVEEAGAEHDVGASPADPGAVSAAEDAVGASALANAAAAVSASAEDDAAIRGVSENGEIADEDALDREPPDEVSEALSAFWAASDAVDRSNAAALGGSDDDGPADTWFDPSLGDSLDDLVDADDVEESGEVRRSNTSPRAAE